jgi:CRISPR-associated protein Csd2
MTPIQNRYDFVYFFDVTNGNPNGDPDAGNLPRMDPETSEGLVSDVCLKRKIRNYVEMLGGERIYVRENSILNETHREAYLAIRGDDPKTQKEKKLSPQSDDEAKTVRRWMCDNFFDVRTFGAVMSTGINCGQVRGPLQFTFGRSLEPILPLEMSITRMAATNEAEKKKQADGSDESDGRSDNRTMGRKHIVPYGLYRAHGFINPKLAEQTGFSEDDLQTVWTALRDMFDVDRSASRGEMTARRLVVFKHDNAMGNAQAHKLFDRVSVKRSGSDSPLGSENADNLPPARKFEDYCINVDQSGLPQGITLIEPF